MKTCGLLSLSKVRLDYNNVNGIDYTLVAVLYAMVRKCKYKIVYKYTIKFYTLRLYPGHHHQQQHQTGEKISCHVVFA
jgi:hypothetical protein